MKLIKRGKTFWIDYRANGVRHRESTHLTNRAEALAFMRQIDTARRMPTFEAAVDVLRQFYAKPREGVISIDALWSTYERIARATGRDKIEPRTFARRKNQVDRFISWLKTERKTITHVEHVTGPIAAGFAAHLADLGLKSKTRANVLGELNSTWKLLEKASVDIRNPWTSLSPRITDAERGKAFSRDQESKILRAAAEIGKDWYPVCVLMRHTGLRYSDVARLMWSDIQNDVIRTIPHKTKAHKIAVTIPLNAPARAAVAGLTRRGDFLFPLHAQLYGNRSRASRETLSFSAVLAAAGVTGAGYSIHSWRHTAATRLAESGAGKDVRKLILGHTTDEMAAHYDHAEHLAELQRALDAASR